MCVCVCVCVCVCLCVCLSVPPGLLCVQAKNWSDRGRVPMLDSSQPSLLQCLPHSGGEGSWVLSTLPERYITRKSLQCNLAAAAGWQDASISTPLPPLPPLRLNFLSLIFFSHLFPQAQVSSGPQYSQFFSNCFVAVDLRQCLRRWDRLTHCVSWFPELQTARSCREDVVLH